MAGLGRKVWSAGDVLAAADVNGYLMDQAVMVFDNSAARGSAVPTASEGMVAYLKDTDSIQVALGTATWSNVASFASGTEGFTALSNGTAGISYQPVSHNYIINGAFDFWQRGTAGAGGYLADRWIFNSSGATITTSQQTFTPAEIEIIGFGDAQFYGRILVDPLEPDDNTGFVQKVEDVRTLAGQNATLTFYAKANKSLTVNGQLNQVFGSGGSTRINKNDTLSITTSWARYSVTISLDSMSGKTIGANSFLEVSIAVPAVDDFTLDLWGIQLEAGSVATPFKRNAPSLQGELAACQRYYQLIAEFDSNRKLIGTGNYISATQMRVDVNLITEMRANPSIEIASVTDAYRFVAPSADDFTTATISLVGRSRVQLINSTQVSGTGGNAGSVFTQLSGGKLAFSAEL